MANVPQPRSPDYLRVHAREQPIRLITQAPSVRHLNEPVPLHFPAEAKMVEGRVHQDVRAFLAALLRFLFGKDHTIGSDQFVYWNRRNPRRYLAPDVFVRLELPDFMFPSWKVWEHGLPELAVEIVSPNDEDIAWEEKLERYQELGVHELVRFDPEEQEGHRLRVWDSVKDVLVEREVQGDTAFCATLRLTWIVAEIPDTPHGLRLADAEGNLVPSALEVEVKARKAAENAREAEAKAREAEAKARQAAENERDAANARVRELEALLHQKTK